MSLKTYETYKDNGSNELNESLPETYGENRNLLPDSTSVLIAYYKDKEHLNWIEREGLYNARAESRRGSLRLGPKETGAKYLLLHTEGETVSGKLYKIKETGPRIFSKQTLQKKRYPTEPQQNFYLVYKLEENREPEFANRRWNIAALNDFRTGRGSGLPFAVTLTELMKVVIK